MADNYEFNPASGTGVEADALEVSTSPRVLRNRIIIKQEDAEGDAVTLPPLTVGGKANASAPTDVDDGDAVHWRFLRDGTGVVADANSMTAANNSIEVVPSTDHVIANGKEADKASASVSVSGSGESDLIAAPGASTALRVSHVGITTDTQQLITIKDGAAGDQLFAHYADAYSGIVIPFQFEASQNTKLVVDLGSGGNAEINLNYVEVDYS